jgi:hypothetical protein
VDRRLIGGSIAHVAQSFTIFEDLNTLLNDGRSTPPVPPLMHRSAVRLPADVGDEFDVYVNGVLQSQEIDYSHADYRQDDTVDVRYEVKGVMRVAHALPLEAIDDGALGSQGEARL